MTLKEIRKSLGLSQRAMAVLFDTTQPTIQRWECSKAKITCMPCLKVNILEEMVKEENELLFEFMVEMDDVDKLIAFQQEFNRRYLEKKRPIIKEMLTQTANRLKGD